MDDGDGAEEEIGDKGENGSATSACFAADRENLAKRS